MAATSTTAEPQAPSEPATPEPPHPIVVAEGVTKIFRDFWGRPKVRAVDGLDLDLMPGEVFGLLGPNGSGKTTTVTMLLGLLYPTRGRIQIFGRSPRNVRAKRRIGYLPEETHLYPYLTCEETLDFYGSLFNLGRRTRRDRIEQLLHMTGLRHARKRVVGEFSKGMARRIGLAQALLNDPDLIILDEPTSGLDPIGTRQVKDLILTLAARGKTVLVCSHLLADVEDVCDRIAILFEGKIHAAGRVRELLKEPDSCGIRLRNLAPDLLNRVLAAVREELGREPELEHPTRNLEQFFLEVVEKARRATVLSPDTIPTPGIPAYLQGHGKARKDVLDRLTVRNPAAAPAAQSQQDQNAGT